MGSDFSAMGKAARALLPVPELSMESIRARSRSAKTRDGVRALILWGVIGIAVLGASAAVGERLYDGVRVWLSGGKGAVVVRSLVLVRQPTASDLRNAIEGATFPVVFPVGVPAGTHVNMIMYAPAGRPNSVTIEYQNERANFKAGFSLFDSAMVNTDNASLPTRLARPRFGQVDQWTVAGETVFVPKGLIALPELNRIKAAMMKASPPDSLAVTETMLRKVTVLGGALELADIAERYAPPGGRSVLVDRQQLRRISSLVKQGKPILDPRTVYLSNIPSVHGEPDYSKATLHWPKTVVISADGVRAIGAVLRSTGAGGDDCGCEVLFNQPSRTTFWVWTIPISTSVTVKKYSVDARTFAVTPLS